MALTLHHQTAAQFAARLRERYKSASREEAARIATWLMNHIDNGDFTETQVRNAFGLNVTQWNTLKAKLTTLRTQWQAIQAAQGE